MSSSPTVIFLMGPTAAGKTDWALELAQALPCDIISVDSALIYRGMDIGTAKPTRDILQQFPHQLIDICDPSEFYSVGQFCHDAQQAICNSVENNRIPLLVGGTMMYFHALKTGLSVLPMRDDTIRQEIYTQAETWGWPMLYAELEKVDPQSASKIHPQDTQRINRALEVFRISGKSLTDWKQSADKNIFPYTIEPIALHLASRAQLHENIEKRFDHMLATGFLAEVETLYQRGDLHADLPAMRSVGYRQAWQYLSGITSKEDMRLRAIAATRQLAKRQLTWLRAWSGVLWIETGDQLGKQTLIERLKNVAHA